MTLRTIFSLVAGLALLVPAAVRGEDFTPVYVAAPVKDLTVTAGTSQSIVKLKKTFALTGVSGDVVRFSTTVGDIDVGLLAREAPKTVAAFTTYAAVTSDNASGAPSYRNTLIQRAIDKFIVQGGGFYISNDNLAQIDGRPTIPGEAGVSNRRGTLSMALSTGPDSATGDWFFNVADNTADRDTNVYGPIINNLDESAGGGPFTVFGRVVSGMSVVDGIVLDALPVETHHFRSPFENVPLLNYDPAQGPSYSNLVYLNSITPLPLLPKKEGQPGVLKVAAKSSNKALVNAAMSGVKLILSYAPGQTGTAKITLTATNPLTGSKVKTKFRVTVE